jgi:glucokinase
MNVIGIDLGGTQIRGAQVNEKGLSTVASEQINATGTKEQVLEQLYRLVDPLMDNTIEAIGIGVPSVVDVEKGIVYDVQNIPSWEEVALKEYMEQRYRMPVRVNNDANCFALGEKYFGKGKNAHSFVGLTVGTGLGAGIIIADRLYPGVNCGAGEFGMVDYLDQYYEYYASGQFFKHVYQTTGEAVFDSATRGDQKALECFDAFGTHLGNAVKMILYTYDPELIILGGSIRHAYRYFQQTLWQRIDTFAYPKSLENFSLVLSELHYSGILGAAALCYNAKEG